MNEVKRSASPQSLRDLVINAGLELIEREGLSLSFDSISYAKVFEYLWDQYQVTVTRGSVHERIWASQDDFRRDVLTESVSYFSDNAMATVLAQQALSSNDASEFALSLGSGTLLELMKRPMFGRFQSVKALSCWFDDTLATETLHELLNARSGRALSEFADQIPTTFRELGLRHRAERGLDAEQAARLWAIITAAVTEGGLINYHAGSHDVPAPVEFMSVAADADKPWCCLSVGIKAVLDALYEPDPDHGDFLSTTAPPPTAVGAGPEAKPSRRSRSQLRELVLTAAVELLFRDGAQLRPDLLTYSTVLKHLQDVQGVTVNRSSIHPRIWTSNEAFRLDVLAACLDASSGPVSVVTEIVEAIQPVHRANGSIDPRRTAAQVFRRGAGTFSGFDERAVDFRRLLQIKSALIDLPDSAARTSLRASVAHVESQRMQGNNAELQSLVIDRGFQVRPEIGISQSDAIHIFQTLSMTMASGIAFNELAGITSSTEPFLLCATGSNTLQKWSPHGFAAWAFFEQLFEEIAPEG